MRSRLLLIFLPVTPMLTLAAPADIPVSIEIVFDNSASMREVRGKAPAILTSFLGQCNPRDEAALLTLSTTAASAGSGFTSDFAPLIRQSASMRWNGASPLFDAVYAALGRSRTARLGRKALLIISDGVDTSSRHSKDELISLAMQSAVQIYSIAIFEPVPNKKGIELQEERQGIFLLEDLTRRTGGAQIVVQNGYQVEQAASKMAQKIRYSPGAQNR